MMNLIKMHSDYIDHLFGFNSSTFCDAMAFLSAVSGFVAMVVAWIAFLAVEISLSAAITAPIVFPLPIHLLHIALFAAWAIKQKDSNQ